MPLLYGILFLDLFIHIVVLLAWDSLNKRAMDSEILNSKYIKYSKGFLNTKQKTVQCAQFSNHLHLKCTD